MVSKIWVQVTLKLLQGVQGAKVFHVLKIQIAKATTLFVLEPMLVVNVLVGELYLLQVASVRIEPDILWSQVKVLVGPPEKTLIRNGGGFVFLNMLICVILFK